MGLCETVTHDQIAGTLRTVPVPSRVIASARSGAAASIAERAGEDGAGG